MNRRKFLKKLGVSAAALSLPGCNMSSQKGSAGASTGCAILPKATPQVPSYLKGYEELYKSDPRMAALEWFKNAKFGLFMHYGLYSILGGGEWAQFRQKIPIEKYEKLTKQFTAKNFDADFITDLALEGGMKYVNLTSKHHDGFCLFDTGNGSWNSMAVAKRDLCAELAEQCQKKGLGCFFYYSLLADWHHPYFYPRKFNFIARPEYKTRPEQYKFEKNEDFQKYLNDATSHIQILLTKYGPVAGIWLDPLMGYYGRPDLFPMDAIYAMIRKLQPQCLISAKQGITGTEDFAAPERSGHALTGRIRRRYGDKAAEIAEKAWESNKDKHNEICDTLQDRAWGYNKKAKHKPAEKVLEMLKTAFEQQCNLLLNTGPLPDGLIHPEDVTALKKVGAHIRIHGWPR
jgi:alpha-L-fucosidase